LQSNERKLSKSKTVFNFHTIELLKVKVVGRIAGVAVLQGTVSNASFVDRPAL